MILKILLSGPPRDVYLQGTYNTRKNVRGRYIRGRIIVMASNFASPHRNLTKFSPTVSKKFKHTIQKQRTLNRIEMRQIRTFIVHTHEKLLMYKLQESEYIIYRIYVSSMAYSFQPFFIRTILRLTK